MTQNHGAEPHHSKYYVIYIITNYNNLHMKIVINMSSSKPVLFLATGGCRVG
jgi:hypothetical protein